MWAAGPFHADLVKHDIVRALGLDPVTARILYPKVTQHHIVAGDQQAFTGALLAREVEDRLIHPLPAHCHAINIQAKPVCQHEPPCLQHDFIARLGQYQRFLQAFLRAIARRDRMRFSQQR